jgi:hypothetical protein
LKTALGTGFQVLRPAACVCGLCLGQAEPHLHLYHVTKLLERSIIGGRTLPQVSVNFRHGSKDCGKSEGNDGGLFE